MKKLFALALTLAASSAWAADEAEIVKGLQNLRNVLSVAQIIEFRRGVGTVPQFDTPLVDPWGTPYRIDIEKGRICGAGSDRLFDEASWTRNEQFTGNEGDVVFQDGMMFRSNRNWLYQQVGEGRTAEELEALRGTEILSMMLRDPEMRQVTAVRLTALAMNEVSRLVEEHRKTHGDLSRLASVHDPAAQLVAEANASPRLFQDAWGTPLRLIIVGDRSRVISAGSDRQFDVESWGTPITADPAEDFVMENGTFVRGFDERALLKESFPAVKAMPQPPDPVPADHLDASKWHRVGGDVAAPSVQERVEPPYPEEYRRLHLSGFVILECEVSETGAVGGVRVLKSLAPDFDMASVDAVRKWKFHPGTRDGNAVPTLFNLTINFKLQ